MKKNISFLLGSGFSIPAGIPGVQELNKRLSKIDENEFMVHSSLIAIWLDGQEDVNAHLSRDQRLFVQEFLEFYNQEILKEGESFHYETFYDFYSGYLNEDYNKEVIEDFYVRFGEKHFKLKKDERPCRDRINDFNNTFNQLLAAKLMKRHHFDDGGEIGNYPFYGGIFPFLSSLVKISDVKVHSLNHDLFFDYIASNYSGLSEHYTDGFQLAGSPYYGRLLYHHQINGGQTINKSYKVKLAWFAEKFDGALSFYKLHGSVLTTRIHAGNHAIRIKGDYGIQQEFYQEVLNEYGQPFFQFILGDVSPDFLSGTTNKTRYYTRDPYYAKLLEHFENNLIDAELLCVIGYGFQDVGINEYLEEHFLSKGGKMIVISPTRPKTNILEKYDFIHIAKSVADVHYQEYLDFLPKELVDEIEKNRSGREYLSRSGHTPHYETT